jgi:RND family efflux transporter MFP subunit
VAYSEVRSPIDGVVAERPLYPGDMASTGQPLATIVNVSRVVARANVPEGEVAAIRVGDPASIALATGSLEVFGKVTVVSPSTDANSTTVQVWVEAINPGERLKPGTSVRTTIVAATIPYATVVPASALVASPEGGTVVWTVSGGVAHQHAVTTGAHEGDKVQIVSGIAPGQLVVTTGALGLADNAKVRIMQPAQAAANETATDGDRE